MDSITTIIVTALVAGAAAGTTKLATQAIQEAYDGLKALIAQRFASQSDLQDAIGGVEVKPDSGGRKSVLEEEFRIAMQKMPDAALDGQLQRQAERLLELIAMEEQVTSMTIIQSGSGSVATGDHAKSAGAGGVVADTISGGVMTGEHARNIRADQYIEHQDVQSSSVFDQSGQTVHGGQTNIAGGVQTKGGPVNTGTMNAGGDIQAGGQGNIDVGDVNVGDGNTGVNVAIGQENQQKTKSSVTLRPGIKSKQVNALDPKLQRAAAKSAVGQGMRPKGASVSPRSAASQTEVDLIGQLKDPAVPVPGLNIVRQLGDLFTATASADAINSIAAHENVVMVQMAPSVAPTLAVSVPEINGTPDQLQAALPPGEDVPDGSGVIVGIVDYGCDFAHENFLDSNGRTRILALWEQEGPFVEGLSPDGFFHGREFDAAAINDALDAVGSPYDALGYDPRKGSHGTHVMDIAVGNGQATGHPGVAPGADIIFVHIGSGGVAQGNSFGNAKNLMEAADYIFQKAAELNRPAVINFSLGTHGGPHDGSTPAERWFDQLLQTPDRAIVISAGNSWQHRAHTDGTVQPDTPVTLTWVIRRDDPTTNEMEIWYDGEHRLEVALVAPDGSRVATVPRGHSQPLFNQAGNEVVSIIHNEHMASNGDHQINVLLDASLAPTDTNHATWQVELRAIGTEEMPYHAWIERDDFESSNQSFFHPSIVSRSHTLGSISCGEQTIVVGSYMAGDPDKGISSFSSEGPTRDGKQKPEVSAPGQHVAAPAELAGVQAAESTTNGVTRKSGTSMAAPHVTGLIALLFQRATEPLTIEQIRRQLIDTVRPVSISSVNSWDPRYGHGRVDGVATLEEMRLFA